MQLVFITSGAAMDKAEDVSTPKVATVVTQEVTKHVLVKDRIALVDDFNRILGPPSKSMANFQREFIDDRMELKETLAFARVCYGLLANAVRGS